VILNLRLNARSGGESAAESYSASVPGRVLVTRRSKRLGFLTALLLAVAFRLPAQEDLGLLDRDTAERVSSKTLSAFEGTPLPVVEKMLELAQVRPGERVYDLGSGDGRVLIMAAQKFGARGVGIELDPRLIRKSLEAIQKLGLGHQVQIIEGDMREQDLSAADVVTIYLTPYGLGKLEPHLKKYLHHGMRIVVVVDEIPGWKPTSSITVQGDNKRSYDLNLYVISRPGDWVSFSKFGHTP
jgi:protein-L-isoaspartate O-methyltransferase